MIFDINLIKISMLVYFRTYLEHKSPYPVQNMSKQKRSLASYFKNLRSPFTVNYSEMRSDVTMAVKHVVF